MKDHATHGERCELIAIDHLVLIARDISEIESKPQALQPPRHRIDRRDTDFTRDEQAVRLMRLEREIVPWRRDAEN
jgi:hypothetical protein